MNIVEEARRKQPDLTEIERSQVMYVAGEDSQGRSVLVVIGSR